MNQCLRDGAPAHVLQQFRKGAALPCIFIPEPDGSLQPAQDFTGLLAAQPGSAQGVFLDFVVHVSEEPGMDGADVTQGIVPQFLHHLAQSVRFQQGAEAPVIQPEMPPFPAFLHGSPQLFAQRSLQVLVIGSRILVDVDDPNLAAGVPAGTSLAVEIVESVRNQGNHKPSLFSYVMESIIS